MIRLENQLGRIRMEDRRQDTRNKIQLGGLVIKAGLAEEETAVLLGAFLTMAQELAGPEAASARRRYRRLGDQAFAAGENEVEPSDRSASP